MGYYFGNPLYMGEQNHVDTWWAVGDLAPQLQQARTAGIKNVVLHLSTTNVADLRSQFTKLSEAGLFRDWDSITLYPMDEPGSAAGGSHSDQEVTDIVTRIRQLGLDIPGLAGVHMGVFYGCDDPKPGIKSFDRVGCFRYGSDGCAKLESDYAALRSQMSLTARLWMIPGGATINGRDGNQDPGCWASYAYRNSDVWGVIAFMWQSGADPRIPITGIRDNGLRQVYCEMGRTILHPTEEPRC